MADWQHIRSAEEIRRRMQADLPMGSTAEAVVAHLTGAGLVAHTDTDGVIHTQVAGAWRVRFDVPEGVLTALRVERDVSP